MAESNPSINVSYAARPAGSLSNDTRENKDQLEVSIRSSATASGDIATSRLVQFDDLYAGDTPTAQLISRVQELLTRCKRSAEAAHTALTDGDLLGAESEMTILLGNLPELFLCRELSDGLGATILALYHGLKNRSDEPLQLDQVFAILTVCKKLQDNPFLPFDSALELIAALQDASFNIDPPEDGILRETLLSDTLA